MNHKIITKELKLDIGEALWRLRREKKLRISKVAEDLSCGETKLDLLETGRKFDYDLLRRLAKYYNKDLKIRFE